MRVPTLPRVLALLAVSLAAGGAPALALPPTIQPIAAQATNEDTALDVIVTIDDPDSPFSGLSLSATSGPTGQGLVPDANLTASSGGNIRTLHVVPATNQFGIVDITVTVSDGVDSASTTFTLTVRSVNDQPVVPSIADVTVNEDTATAPLPFVVTDSETAAGNLFVTARSSAPSIVPNTPTNLALGCPQPCGSARTLTIRPAPNAYGVASITVTADDGTGGTGATTFLVTVAPVNDPPTISVVADVAIDEDTTTGPLSFTIGDPDNPIANPAAGLTVAVSASNPALVAQPGLALAGSGALRTVAVTPLANQNGATTITLTVSDGLVSSTKSFTTTVRPIDDPPTLAPIADLQIDEDTEGVVPVVIGDVDAPPSNPVQGLTLTAMSTNPTLVPNTPAALDLGGAGTNRTLRIVPALGQDGTAGITVRVADSTSPVPLVATRTFTVTVRDVPCSATPSSTSLVVNDAGLSPVTLSPPSLGVATRASCAWTAQSLAQWVVVQPPGSGFGNGAVMLSIAANTTGAPRVGAVVVDGTVVTVTQAGPVTTADGDGDTLPDAWERQFGLDPASITLDNGAAGDPDGDGVSNLEELRAGTHPRGFFSRYLAEGASSTFFDTRIALMNPSSSAGLVLARFELPNGGTASYFVVVPPHARRTVDVGANVPRLAGAAFATTIEADVEIVADRTMTWGGGYGAHAETSVARPLTTWYFAEGATHSNFSLFYLLQNPSPTDANVQITYFRPAPAPPIVRSYTVGAQSRLNVWVGVDPVEPELASTDVSAMIASSVPIVAERAMYATLPGQPFGAGHDGAGIAAPDTDWFLAEGAVTPFFQTFVLIANPASNDADVEVTFLQENGAPVRYRDGDPQTGPTTFRLPANSRKTIWVNLVPSLAPGGVSTVARSVNGVPILVERAMWWPGPPGNWYEAHASAATSTASTLWGLADGEVGGGLGVDTFVLVANTSATTPARVRMTLFFEDGSSAVREGTVAPARRDTTWINNGAFVDAVTGAPVDFSVRPRFGVLVESLPDPAAGVAQPTPVVVERAMYWTAAGQVWAAGTNVVATMLR